MRQDGATYADLCETFDKSEDTIRRAIREADAAWVEAETILAASETPEQTVSTADDVSRSIVVVDPIPAKPDTVPSTVPAGEVRVDRWTRVCATVTTRTARWEWFRVEDVWGRGFNHDEWRLLTPASALRPEDAALGERARQELVSGAAKPSRREQRSTSRISSRTRAVARETAPLPSLDPAREAELYAVASGGWSTPRRWHLGLVAA